MKELSIEEKAKRYDEAIEKAKEMIKAMTNIGGVAKVDDIQYLFPELKESEDKKPNGAIVMEDFNEGNGFYKVNLAYLNKEQVEDIEYIIKRWNAQKYDEKAIRDCIGVILTDAPEQRFVDFNTSLKDCLAWLEKQGKNNIGISEATKQELEDNLNKALEKETPESWNEFLDGQGEQKPADLKTKAGNWYVCNMEVVNENMVTAFHCDEVYYCPKDGYIDVDGALFEVGSLDVFRLATEKEIPQPKQKWSEEDEKDLFNTAKYLREYAERCVQGEYSKIEIFSLADRIESLRPQNTWKPSDEQMKALWDSIPEDVKEISEREMLLNELYKDLKKL